ncbi:MAG TPA: allantoinase PuuE [Acidocella sp.]|nr:allantoinase PuuE [Acidocella sp.]
MVIPLTGVADTLRDLIGYGVQPPHAGWPRGAKIAISFVLNYEEGAENTVLNGDAASESFLSDIVNAVPVPGMRHVSMESLYDYGARAGFWRVRRLFDERKLPLTVFGVAMAMEKNPEAVAAMQESGWEIASHGYRWINYQHVPEAIERAHMRQAIDIHTALTGSRPLGWYIGRTSPNSARLVVKEGGFVYDSDSYADDLPYYDKTHGKPQLILPYALDTNDMRFTSAQGFNAGEQFHNYLKNCFDSLYAEGDSAPKMMSVGLHCRIIGRPGRIASLARFLDYVQAHERVWIAQRIDIARHWQAVHAV